MKTHLNPKIIKLFAQVMDEDGQMWKVTGLGISSLQTGKYSSVYVELTSEDNKDQVQLSASEFESTFNRFVDTEE